MSEDKLLGLVGRCVLVRSGSDLPEALRNNSEAGLTYTHMRCTHSHGLCRWMAWAELDPETSILVAGVEIGTCMYCIPAVMLEPYGPAGG